jgi:hypothetical protein
LVLARDAEFLDRKLAELESLGYPYIVVCGERVNNPNVVFRRRAPKNALKTEKRGICGRIHQQIIETRATPPCFYWP